MSDGDEVRRLYRQALKNRDDNIKRKQQEKQINFDKYYPEILKIITKCANNGEPSLYVYFASYNSQVPNLGDPNCLFVPFYFMDFFISRGFSIKGRTDNGFFIQWADCVRYDD